MSLPELSPQMNLFSVESFLAAAFEPANPFRLFSERIYPLLLNARPALAEAYCRATAGQPLSQCCCWGCRSCSLSVACRIAPPPKTLNITWAGRWACGNRWGWKASIRRY